MIRSTDEAAIESEEALQNLIRVVRVLEKVRNFLSTAFLQRPACSRNPPTHNSRPNLLPQRWVFVNQRYFRWQFTSVAAHLLENRGVAMDVVEAEVNRAVRWSPSLEYRTLDEGEELCEAGNEELRDDESDR